MDRLYNYSNEWVYKKTFSPSVTSCFNIVLISFFLKIDQDDDDDGSDESEKRNDNSSRECCYR